VLFNQDLTQLSQTVIAAVLIILISFPVHEFSHAFAAFRLGDSTARYQGRLTLDPRAHFDPIGGSILLISAVVGGFFIGWAKPTPVNPYNLRYGRKGDALVALAGPLSNLVIAAIVALPLRLVLSNFDLMLSIASNDVALYVVGVVEFFLVMNIVLMLFNLLPIPPLDGWHVLLDLVNARLAYQLRQYEQYGFVLILLLIVAGGPYLRSTVDFIERILLGI
jgi:Zn-dependent protease